MRAVLMLAACAVIVSGCEQVRRPDDRICLTPGSPAQGDYATCVHRWAYRLAIAPVKERDVAEAVVAGCLEAIDWSVSDIEDGLDRDQQWKFAYTRSQAMAFFHVVQARAGNCEIP